MPRRSSSIRISASRGRCCTFLAINGALDLLAAAREEMAMLGMQEKPEDSLFADQCEIRKAFDPKNPASVPERYQLTTKVAMLIMNTKMMKGNAPLQDVVARVIPNPGSLKSITEAANKAVTRNGGRIMESYYQKLAQVNREKANQAKAGAVKVKKPKEPDMEAKKTTNIKKKLRALSFGRSDHKPMDHAGAY